MWPARALDAINAGQVVIDGMVMKVGVDSFNDSWQRTDSPHPGSIHGWFTNESTVTSSLDVVGRRSTCKGKAEDVELLRPRPLWGI